ncbi:MAG: NAD(P)/FAD-dependent oxidoreductase [Planctomycetaceae bacterium]|nr:NAD(P)/FAD-dependent oxidoreductase [Planctomycetaceae bacterium]
MNQTDVVSRERAVTGVDSHAAKTRIMILGGGFGGAYTARHLETLCKRHPDVEIVLVSRDNFLLMTPLLFEVCSGTLDLRHCSLPIRAFLRTTRFGEAAVQGIDLERRVVHVAAHGSSGELSYDHLVLALGAMTNQKMIPGSENAFTFKTLADAFLLRNHMIECFERADVELEPKRKRRLLTFMVIGGGLVGVELFGELTAFVDEITPFYRHVSRDEVRFLLLQAGDRIMPEIDPKLAEYGARLLGGRHGTEIRTHAPVRAIEPGKIHLPEETIEAETIVLAAGIVPNPVVAGLPVEKDQRGHIVVDGTMRCKSRPEVWALGDCAFIPAPDGKPYPNLAQHTLREAKVLAHNIYAVLNGRAPQPFVYDTLGMMGSLGHSRAFGQLLKVRLHGFLAWFVRRTYYLLQMPGWSRRLRIMSDWTFALLFRPDIVKIGLESETVLLFREAAAGAVPENRRTEGTSGSAEPFLGGVNGGRPSGQNG